MKKKILIIGVLSFIMAATIFSVVSCNKDIISEKAEEQLQMRSADPEQIEIYEVRKAFAQTFYRALAAEPDLRSFIYQKCLIADTSGYELIYLALKNEQVARDLKFSEILALHADPVLLGDRGANFFDVLTDVTPLLTVAFPDLDLITLNDWSISIAPGIVAVSTINDLVFTIFNTENLNGLEIIMHEGQREEDVINSPILVVYDAEIHYLVKNNGETHWGTHIDSHMPGKYIDGEPDQHDQCKWLWLQANGAWESYMVSGEEFFLIEHNELLGLYYNCLNGEPLDPRDDPPCDEPCERDCEEEDEWIVDFKINGWKVYQSIKNQCFEKWFKFHADILALTRNDFGGIGSLNIKAVFGSYKKGQILECGAGPCKGIWKIENYRWYSDWEQDHIGSPIQVAWSEVDGGSTTVSAEVTLQAEWKLSDSVTVKGGGKVGYSYTGTPVVELGSAPVFYCDPILNENNTGQIKFRLN